LPYGSIYLNFFSFTVQLLVSKTRYILLNCSVIASILILLLQLFRLQVVEQQDHSQIADGNALRNIRVVPARGSIYDRNGTVLVHNVPKYTVTLTPTHFDESNIRHLAQLLEIPDSVVARKLEEASHFNPYKPSPAFSNVSFEQYSRISEDAYLLPGVGTEINHRRHYPTDARSSHALGYTGEISPDELLTIRSESDSLLYRQGDYLGKTGVERSYEPWLRGVPGIARRWVNIYGLEVMTYAQGQADQKPREYYDLHLALDAQVQALAESLFVNKRGAAIALNPNDGSIIALVSKPDYALELFDDGIQNDTWLELINHTDKPLYNRATMNLMPPGSTWKPFMALFALSEGLLGDHGHETTIYCPGYHPAGRGRYFRCTNVHGSVNVVDAIRLSCNTFFFEIARRMNISAFHEYANKFGFGVKSPFDLREQTSGLIPDSAYFSSSPSYVRQSLLMNLGIGQGDMGVTPLQLARYTTVLANGGTLYPPHLVSHFVNRETGESFRPPNLPPPVEVKVDTMYMELVRQGMKLVMESGTGVMSQIPGIPSAGKTGTSQAPGDFTDHSVFIMFAPYDNPQIALAVHCENTGDGSHCAAPIASLLAEQYLKGEIPASWQKNIRMDRAMSAISESLITENDL